jgi:3'-phosphoadenosine 5'-phosphosulfate sulfotransferase (PAPS reductase)/FAD synthetase
MAWPDHYRLRFTLWARTRQHQWRVQQAAQRVTAWLTHVQRPYVAFSGGKDSQCCLHLVRAQAPDTPAVYLDAQCAFPEVTALIEATPHCLAFPADEPFLTTLARYGLHDDRLERATMQTTVYGPVQRLLAQEGFDGVCYGLRAEESPQRQRHAQARGAVFQYRRDGVWACQPLWDWRYNDVWAYILTHDLPYCGVYDRLWDAPEADQRVSYWAGETKRRWGRYAWVKRNYPGLWNQLVAAVPEVTAYA